MEAADLTRRMNEFYQVASEVLRDVQDITDQQIKHWIVNPFLITLGWDPHDKKQVFLDFPVKSDGGHADYALLDLAGRARMILEVGGGKETIAKAEEAGRKAKLLGAPLALITNGQEFSLWFIGGDEPATPLFVLPLKELAENAEALLGLTVEYPAERDRDQPAAEERDPARRPPDARGELGEDVRRDGQLGPIPGRPRRPRRDDRERDPGRDDDLAHRGAPDDARVLRLG